LIFLTNHVPVDSLGDRSSSGESGYRLRKTMKKIKHEYILVIFATIFFVIYSYVSFTSPPKFVSPDEVTNYFFTNLYSQTGQFRYTDELNEIAMGIIHPRSTVYVDGNIIPMKFIGFPLINGTIASVLPEMVRFLTPLLAVIGAVFLYLLVRDLYNQKLALLSFLLLLIMPPYWYWSTLAMYENIAGCFFLIISVRYFFKLLDTNEPKYFLLVGLFLGLSLFIRPEYILFAVPLLLIFLWNIKKIKKAYISLSVFSLIAALAPFFILNNELYGSPLLTGQHMHYQWSQAIPKSSFSIANFFENSSNLIDLTPLLFLCGLLGLFYCIKKRIHLPYMAFFIVWLLVPAFYFLSGRIGPTGVHSSYVRYLLPVYLLSLPLISYFVLSLRAKFVSVLLVFVMLIVSILTVLPVINDNLESVKGYDRQNSTLVNETQPDAVIFVEYWDKVIFPERKVGLVKELPEENRSEMLAEIVIELYERGVPVYLLIEKNFKEVIDYEALVEELSARKYILMKNPGTNNLYGIGMAVEK
jgi:hypothetical protein